jgi:hypothetical protein
MYNYEVDPPKNAWDQIAASLDESLSENKFPSRLYDMEVPPPASTWETISTSFDEQEENVVSIKRRRSVFFRYAVAAAFTGLAVIGVIRLTTNGPGKPEKGTASNNTETTSVSSPNVHIEENKMAIAESRQGTTKTTDARLQEKKTASSSQNNSLISHAINIKSVAPSSVPYQDGFASNDAGNNSFYDYNYEDVTVDISKRYIMLMTPDGNIIRMSKKWSDLVCCVSGEEQDEDCKTQLKEWQKKLATSPVSPSSGSFLDLLELVSSLDNNPDM